MLGDMYQKSTEFAVQDLIRNPAPQPAADNGFSFWRTLGAVPRGMAAGVLSAEASIVDLLGPFGDIMAAYGGLPDPEADRERRRKEADEARKRIQSGEMFEMGSGDRVRETIRENVQPNAETAHAAEQVVYGFAKTLSGAAAGAVIGGIPGAVGVVGVSEGLSAADELKREGVDLGTRVAAGALAGAGAGIGVALPVAGRGIASTAALVGLGGPGAFVAQQAATRAILDNADYSELADQYDPFDPVGLAVSTLAPAAFGAFALRSRFRSAKGKEGGGDLAGQPPDSDVVDAARVSQSSDAIQAARLTPADDFLAAQVHVRAMDEAMTQMAMGQRVEVADMVPVDAETARPAIELAERAARAALEADPDLPAAVAEARARPLDVVGEEGRTPAATPEPARAASGAEEVVSPLAAAEARLQEIIARRPDLQVRINEAGDTMRLDEVVERIRAESQANANDADLIQVAANCFLSSGL